MERVVWIRTRIVWDFHLKVLRLILGDKYQVPIVCWQLGQAVTVEEKRTYARGTWTAVLGVTTRKVEHRQKCGSMLLVVAMQMRPAPWMAVQMSCTPEKGIPPRGRVKETCWRIIVLMVVLYEWEELTSSKDWANDDYSSHRFQRKN